MTCANKRYNFQVCIIKILPQQYFGFICFLGGVSFRCANRSALLEFRRYSCFILKCWSLLQRHLVVCLFECPFYLNWIFIKMQRFICFILVCWASLLASSMVCQLECPFYLNLIYIKIQILICFILVCWTMLLGSSMMC